MNTFVVEEFERFVLVTFYTVRKDGHDYSETDKFIERFLYNEHKEDLQNILTLIEDIGENRGAKDLYFSRKVNEAQELPPAKLLEVRDLEIPFYDNVLRLFCVKISEGIVILFNGGLKSSQVTQDSPDLRMPFYEAQGFAKRIWQAIRDEILEKNEATRTLKDGYGGDEIVL